jgi:uncharacterized integral membrane protein
MNDPRKPGSEEGKERQPLGLYATLIGLALVIGYVIAFVVENSKKVSIHWVFGTTHASLIFVILVSLAIGIFLGVLVLQLYRRRRRRSHPVAPEHTREPADPVRDPGG